ncbi:MAG: cytidylate kinase family protein, partial [archaeon]
MKNKKIPILISGEIGSGKSTLAKRLARKYGARYISASAIHHQLIRKRLHLQKTRSVSTGFWETQEGKESVQLRVKEMDIDRDVDRQLLAFLEKNPDTVTDARLMPWLYEGKAIRIWLEAEEKERVKRVSERDGMKPQEVKKDIRSRRRNDQKIWKKLYGIRFGKDPRLFDLILKNDTLSHEQTYQIIHPFIDTRFMKEK